MDRQIRGREKECRDLPAGSTCCGDWRGKGTGNLCSERQER